MATSAPQPQRPEVPAASRQSAEADRVSTHRRQLEYVRASLRRGVAYAPAAGRPEDRAD